MNLPILQQKYLVWNGQLLRLSEEFGLKIGRREMAVQVQQKCAVGYFLSTSVDEFVFMGGAMVTDRQGLPLEFRYTEPVRANKLQRLLYGDVLERFIHTDVILSNLFSRLEQKPTLIIVSDDTFISAVGTGGTATIWLAETRIPRLTASGESQDISSTEFLIQLSETGSPTRVRTAEGAANAENRSEICRQLIDLSRTMEIGEPLRRVDAAIKLIWQEANDDKAEIDQAN